MQASETTLGRAGTWSLTQSVETAGGRHDREVERAVFRRAVFRRAIFRGAVFRGAVFGVGRVVPDRR
ncbi:pentapeptide repeat-containing protein [Rhodococcus artemisiae]|uniref:pentapeptide repeat-containing protein n=1 Tax=Rhodococcus artemisiae TaxID=714159 RepID=UPI0038B5D90F